jgi:hypothetical protein
MQKLPVRDVISAVCEPVSLPSRTDLERTHSFSFVCLSRNPHDTQKCILDIKTCVRCFSTTSAWKISRSDKYFVSYYRDKSRSHVKCELLLWAFNQIWNIHIMVSETLQYLILRKKNFAGLSRTDEQRDATNLTLSFTTSVAKSPRQLHCSMNRCHKGYWRITAQWKSKYLIW